MDQPKLKAPPGACDCHMHIYEARFPVAATATFQPPDAQVSAYRDVQRALGLQRVVVVQPSSYGWDNTCTLEAVTALNDARGIVVIGTEVTDAELKRLTDRGVRGVRYFMLPGGVLGWDTLDTMAARIAPYGWHIQLQLDGRLLRDYEATLRGLPCDLVIDHNGKFLEPVAIEHPAFQTLLSLLDTGRCWAKLSAPYETSKVGPPTYADVSALAKALVRANSERCVWATNWPHPNRSPQPSTAAMLDLLMEWAPSERDRHRILVDNPTRLYGF